MKTINFTKMQGSGNDFVVIESLRTRTISPSLVKRLCDRIFGIGADGVLLLEKSKKADVRMRIFNADGSETQMCGNGARCCALYMALKVRKACVTIETKAGLLSAHVNQGLVKLKMTDPVDLKLDIAIPMDGKAYEVDYVNTGVPHAVIEVDDLTCVPVKEAGRKMRHHEVFKPSGTNVNFINVKDKNHIFIRTYERGVEDETLSCGTGSVASAIITVLNHGGESLGSLGKSHKVFVTTRSQEILKVYFRLLKSKISDVWLEGKAKIVFKGSIVIVNK